MGNRKTDGDRRQDAERHAAEVRETALRTRLKAELERALALGPDALATLQYEAGHDLIRTPLPHPRLRFLDTAGMPADRVVLLPQPAPVVDLHDAGTSERLSVIETRLDDERSLPQAEREPLTPSTIHILKRLGELSGRVGRQG